MRSVKKLCSTEDIFQEAGYPRQENGVNLKPLSLDGSDIIHCICSTGRQKRVVTVMNFP